MVLALAAPLRSRPPALAAHCSRGGLTPTPLLAPAPQPLTLAMRLALVLAQEEQGPTACLEGQAVRI